MYYEKPITGIVAKCKKGVAFGVLLFVPALSLGASDVYTYTHKVGNAWDFPPGFTTTSDDEAFTNIIPLFDSSKGTLTKVDFKLEINWTLTNNSRIFDYATNTYVQNLTGTLQYTSYADLDFEVVSPSFNYTELGMTHLVRSNSFNLSTTSGLLHATDADHAQTDLSYTDPTSLALFQASTGNFYYLDIAANTPNWSMVVDGYPYTGLDDSWQTGCTLWNTSTVTAIYTYDAVPEPTSLSLLALGALAFARRRSKR